MWSVCVYVCVSKCVICQEHRLGIEAGCRVCTPGEKMELYPNSSRKLFEVNNIRLLF